MIRRLSAKNFRGLEDTLLDLTPITLLTGPNNAGKSTVPYALFTLKNVLANPAQPLDSFFNLGFVNLGGFKQTVFAKDEDRSIVLGIEAGNGDLNASYQLSLGKQASSLHLGIRKPFPISVSLDVTFPYSLTLNTAASLEYKGHSFQASWNGLATTVTPMPGESESRQQEAIGLVSEVSRMFGYPAEEIRRVDMVPLRRGFTKPVYSAVPIQAQLLTEDEIATVLASDPDLLNRVDHALEQVLARSLRVFTPPSTATFYLHSVNRENGMTSELVNEGFGTNQLVFLLAKTFRQGIGTVCVEEPEIHLHPSAISRFVKALAKTAKEPLSILRRQFVITTHSEHLVIALLALVAEGMLQPEDLALYYVSRAGYETRMERSEVTDKGQVKGGLRGFYEAELAAARALLGADT